MDDSVRRIYFALGAICILVGGVLLGMAGYTFLLDDDPEDQWVYVRPSVAGGDTAVAAEAVGPDGEPSELGDQPYDLVIEKLGVEAPVARFGLDENAVPEVPYERNLVAWYDFSSPPGIGSNAVYAGHRTWRGDAVFLRLSELSSGDQIILRGDDGAQLVYAVSAIVQVDPADRSALDWMKATETDSITLITCGGEFFATNDFAGGDYTHRVVVRADRVEPSVSGGTGSGADS